MAMKSLLKDESAVLNPLLAGLLGLFILVLNYVVFVPMENYLIYLVTSLGAPAGPAQFYGKMMIWGFVMMGVACIVYPFIYAYKKTYDQGQELRGFR
jgi:hypothetical protein